MSLRMCFNPEALLSDLHSLFHSYGAEVRYGDEVLESGPLYIFATGLGVGQYAQSPNIARTGLEIAHGAGPFSLDGRYTLRMTRFNPDPEAQTMATRWPFYVDSILRVEFAFDAQWWMLQFSPGKKYEEREF